MLNVVLSILSLSGSAIAYATRCSHSYDTNRVEPQYRTIGEDYCPPHYTGRIHPDYVTDFAV